MQLLFFRKILFLAFLLGFSVLYAQPKNPSKGGSNECEPSDKNNVRLLMNAGRACMGRMSDPDASKNYKYALKWFEKANDKSKGDSATFELFALKLMGGYDLDPNPKDARKYLDVLLTKNDYTLRFAYQTDVSLSQVFDLQSKANGGDQKAQVDLARIFYEYGLSEHLAKGYLDMATSNKDAVFLKQKWELYKSSQEPDLTKKIIALAEKEARNGSDLARMEYVFWTVENGEKMPFEKANSLLMSLLQKNNPQDESYLKAFCLLLRASKGKGKIETLRKMVDMQNNPILQGSFWADDALFEALNFDKACKTMENFAQLAAFEDVKEMKIDFAEYAFNFHGDYQKLIQCYRELGKAENLALIGKENYPNYANEVKKRMRATIMEDQQIETLVEIYKFLNKAENRDWLPANELDVFEHQIHDNVVGLFGRSPSLEKMLGKFIKISQENIKGLVDAERLAEYKDVIKSRIRLMISETNTMRGLLDMFREFEGNVMKRDFYPNYKEELGRKMFSVAGSKADTAYHIRKIDLQSSKWKSLELAKNQVGQIANHADLTPEHKAELLPIAKVKALKDVYGEVPNDTQMAELQKNLKTLTWLEPQATQTFNNFIVKRETQGMNAQKFTIEAGKAFYDKIDKNKDYAKPLKDSIFKVLRPKVVKDLCGENPSEAILSGIKDKIGANAWLMPEGKDLYWYFVAQKEVPAVREMAFNSFEEAKTYCAKINGDKERPQEAKDLILSIVREKVVRTVYGSDPNPEQISELQRKLITETWLLPEGRNVFFEYKNNSSSSFTGQYADADSSRQYLYEVEKQDENVYQVKLYKILRGFGGKNMIYPTTITVNSFGDRFEVDVQYFKHQGGVNWLKFNNNYLRLTYPKVGVQAEIQPTGKKFNEIALDRSHRHNRDYLLQKEENGSFSAKAAIRTAIKYFLFSYRNEMLE